GPGAPDYARPGLADQVPTFFLETYGVNQDRAPGKHAELMQFEYFFRRLGVASLSGVDEERRSGGRRIESRADLRFKREGVRPAVAPHNTNREKVIEYALVRIVVADRSDPARQIPQAAPPQAQRFGNLQMLAQRRFAGTINIARPLGGVRVNPAAQAREKREFQMVVRVDQPGQDLQALQIEFNSLDGSFHFFVQRATKIAAWREASSNWAGFPAWANTARSGSPNFRSVRQSSFSPGAARSSSS